MYCELELCTRNYKTLLKLKNSVFHLLGLHDSQRNPASVPRLGGVQINCSYSRMASILEILRSVFTKYYLFQLIAGCLQNQNIKSFRFQTVIFIQHRMNEGAKVLKSNYLLLLFNIFN